MAGGRTDTIVESNLRSRSRERGQSVVEFALLLPVFLMVIFIAVDFGVGLSRWVVLTNATREGARLGVTGAAANEIRDKTASTSNDIVDPTDVKVNYVDVSGNGTTGDKGDSVIVEANYDYGLITPLKVLLDLAFDSLTFSSCTDMRLELSAPGAADDGTRC